MRPRQIPSSARRTRRRMAMSCPSNRMGRRSWTTASEESGLEYRAGCPGMRRRRAGLSKDISRRYLRNTELPVRGRGRGNGPLTGFLQSERYRRERDEKQDEREPSEHAARPRQRPVLVQHPRGGRGAPPPPPHPAPPPKAPPPRK